MSSHILVLSNGIPLCPCFDKLVVQSPSDMVNHGDPFVYHPIWESIDMRQYISLSAVVCLLWEHALTISQEYTFVWKSRLTVTKWLYLAMRYFSIACQLANHWMSANLLSSAPLTKATCTSWFNFQASYVTVVHSLFELILIVRVWVLYRKAGFVGVMLACMYLTEQTLVWYTLWHAEINLDFDETCLLMKTPKEAYTLAFAPLFTEGVIWAMTLYKKISGFGDSPRYGFGINPSITTLMFRDGLIAFLLISSIIIFCLSYSLYVHDLQNTVWSILVTTLSIWGGRIVMNMQRLKVPPIPPQVELASPASTTIHFLHESEEEDTNAMHVEFPM